MKMIIAAMLAMAALLLVMPASVHADVAVIRPLPKNPPPTSEDLAAMGAVTEALQLANIRAISPEEAAGKLVEAAQNPCLEVDCANSVLTALGADMLVAVVVARDGTRIVDVVVGLIDAEGRYVNEEVPIENGDVAAATRAAIARALTKWPARGLIPLRVVGSPAGATVLVDGQPRGVLPVELRVQPGEHVITVSIDGQQDERVFNAPSTPGQPIEVRFELGSSRQPARRNIIGGSVLAGVGLATLVSSLIVLKGKGCASRGPSGYCAKSEETEPLGLGVWAGGGALALVGGVAWLSVGIHQWKVSRRGTVDVAVGPAGFNIKGSF